MDKHDLWTEIFHNYFKILIIANYFNIFFDWDNWWAFVFGYN